MNNVDMLSDMNLFVKIVHGKSMAAAGRELGLTPSSVTTRIKNLERHYEVRLLNRTTRSISLTDAGRGFYKDCLETLETIRLVESKLKAGKEQISGPIRITATSDLGQQHVAPLLSEFVKKYPNITPYLNMSDAVTPLAESNIDIAVRYGLARDSLLIAQKLSDSRRVLCASPKYLHTHGKPERFSDLAKHSCLTMVQAKKPMATWYFDTPDGEEYLTIDPARSCDDGAQIRQWAIEGAGIALKSILDIAEDLNAGRLVTVMDDLRPDNRSKSDPVVADLFVAYQDRKYLPVRVHAFIDELKSHFKKYFYETDLAKRL